MTTTEFAKLMLQQQAIWPHAAIPSEQAVVYDLLRDITYEEAVAALKEHAASGAEFPPGAPGIIRRVAGAKAPAVDFDMVWGAFIRAQRLGAFAEVPFEGRLDQFYGEFPVEVAAFVREHYREYAMSGGPNGDPVTVVRAQLRAAWEARAGRRVTAEAHRRIGLERMIAPGLPAAPPSTDPALEGGQDD